MKRFAKKIDHILWFLIAILPLIVYFIVGFNNDINTDFNTFISSWGFDFINDIFNQIFTGNLAFPVPLVTYLSYLVSVEIVHIFFDFCVFIPRFAHSFCSRLYNEK